MVTRLVDWQPGVAHSLVLMREPVVAADGQDNRTIQDGLDPNTAGRPAEESEALLELLGLRKEPGQPGRLGPYEVTGLVGRGGMGVVLMARGGLLRRGVRAGEG